VQNEANHENPAPQKTFPAHPHRGFAFTLTLGTVGVYATATGPDGIQWVSAVFHHPELAIFHARSLVDGYLRALEIAGRPYPGDDMPGLLRRIVNDGPPFDFSDRLCNRCGQLIAGPGTVHKACQ
jgi:hypothetical protein